MNKPDFAALLLVCAVLVSGLPAMALADEPRDRVRLSDYRADPDEPRIVIRHQEDRTIYEYRVAGEIREIKVVPEVGPAYYLVPADGGFIREDRSQVLIPSWVLFRW